MRRDINHLPEQQNGFLSSGKKSELITLSAINANIAFEIPGNPFFIKAKLAVFF